jgi:rifampin ADP-ribosylating transferase
MDMKEKGKLELANKIFLQAWNEATDEFEKFIAAHFVARHKKNVPDKSIWFKTSLTHALKINDDTVTSAFPSLYSNIAKCYEDLGDTAEAKRNYELADSFKTNPLDRGPFYHGTKADLHVGDLLIAGNKSNYKHGLKMNHIYFTALVNGAGLAAALAKGDGRERVYIVEPTGSFDNDPNVTDKKFPGNLTRSYRTQSPLKIIGEVKDWVKQTPDELQMLRQKIENSKGEIIN